MKKEKKRRDKIDQIYGGKKRRSVRKGGIRGKSKVRGKSKARGKSSAAKKT